MQVLERAVRMMKAPANEGARDRVDSGDIPVTDFPEMDFDDPEAIDPPLRAEAPIVPPLIRSRIRPTFSDDPVEEAPMAATPLFAEDRAPVLPEGDVPDGDAPEDRPEFGPLLTWLGAAASVALILGISVWTYKLGQRDAMDVPIIAALEGPARIAPENAGGTQMAHQGLSVNGVLEGGGVAEVAPTVTVSAGGEPLTDEDAPQAELAAIAATRKPQVRPESEREIMGHNMETVLLLQELKPEAEEIAGEIQTVEPEQIVEPITAAVAEVREVVPSEEEVAAAVADAIALATPTAVAAEEAAETGLPVVAAVEPEPEVTPAAEPVKPVEIAALGPTPPLGEGSAHAPAMLVLPRARPADLGAEMAAAVDAAVASVLSAQPEPAVVQEQPAAAVADVNDLTKIPLPEGTRLIQLGAFDSEAVARRQWDQLSGRHSDLLGGKDHYVQKIDRSGRTFYRLRVAGYANKQETLAACAALTARGLPCMPAINR